MSRFTLRFLPPIIRTADGVLLLHELRERVVFVFAVNLAVVVRATVAVRAAMNRVAGNRQQTHAPVVDKRDVRTVGGTKTRSEPRAGIRELPQPRGCRGPGRHQVQLRRTCRPSRRRKCGERKARTSARNLGPAFSACRTAALARTRARGRRSLVPVLLQRAHAHAGIGAAARVRQASLRRPRRRLRRAVSDPLSGLPRSDDEDPSASRGSRTKSSRWLGALECRVNLPEERQRASHPSVPARRYPRAPVQASSSR